MKAFTLGAAITLVFSATAFAQAPTWTVPEESQRCPSKWGAADERGSGNHQKPAAVMNAAKLIKTGEVFELAHVLGPSMAFFGTRRFDVHTKRTFMNQFSNMRGSNEEVVISELGQVGTQFDGFAHQTHLNSWYNCQKVDENTERTGFKKFGIHNVGALFTRGVLIDVAGFKGVEMLGDNYEITVDDLEGALKKQNDAAARRRSHHPHRLGQALRQGQPALREILPGHRRAGRPLACHKGSDATRRRQLAGRGRAQSRQTIVASGASGRARGERHPFVGEPQTRRARAKGRQRIRLRDAAAQDSGWLGLDSVADRGAVAAVRFRQWVASAPETERASRNAHGPATCPRQS